MSALHDRELSDTLEAQGLRNDQARKAREKRIAEAAERWPATFARLGAECINVADGFDRDAHVAMITRVVEEGRE